MSHDASQFLNEDDLGDYGDMEDLHYEQDLLASPWRLADRSHSFVVPMSLNMSKSMEEEEEANLLTDSSESKDRDSGRPSTLIVRSVRRGGRGIPMRGFLSHLRQTAWRQDQSSHLSGRGHSQFWPPVTLLPLNPDGLGGVFLSGLLVRLGRRLVSSW